MLQNLTPYLVQWAISALALWLASLIFKGLKFDSAGALIGSALLLGLANALVRPLLILLTLPLTLLTFGLFLLVVNALVLLLVAAPVRGFRLQGFWTAFFASIFISIVSMVVGTLVDDGTPATTIQIEQGGEWL